MFNVFVSPAMAVNQAYDHNGLFEYKGYGQAMYETVVDETVFFAGQYTNNKEYVSKTIDQIGDYAKFWKDEAINMWEEDTLRAAIEKGGGYLLTVGDWVKKLFTGYGEKYHPPQQGFADYSQYITHIEGTKDTYRVNDGYKLNVGKKYIVHSSGQNQYRISGYTDSGKSFSSVTDISKVKSADLAFYSHVTQLTEERTITGSELKRWHEWTSNGEFGIVVLAINAFGEEVNFEKIDGGQIQQPKPNPNTDFDKMKKYIDEKIDKLAIPEPKPYLSCPNGARIEMSVSGSTFLAPDGSVVVVNKDGTSMVDSAICNLGWDKPEIKYDNDRPVMETPDGKWKDIETGLIVGGDSGYQCVENGVVVSCKDIEKPDGSILEYIKNAYEYATGFIKSAVDGLKSLGTGAVELTKLYGVFFGWLPKEIVILMTSGLGIMLGLRIFRK